MAGNKANTKPLTNTDTGRGLWPPADPDPSVALWQGRWPLPERPVIPECTEAPLRAGSGNATRVSPARAQSCLVDPQVRERQRPAPDPAGKKRPLGEGRALVSLSLAGPVV